jgi:hypothetical protein
MSTNTKQHRSIAVLKLPKKVPDLINLGQVVIKGITNNTFIPNPNPSVAVVQKGLDDLVAAQAAATVRTSGAVALRNSKKGAFITLLEAVKTDAQSVADANPENGAAIIQSTGMALRKVPVRKQLGFHAKLGTVTGAVKVVAPAAARRASYEWQYSTDGGKTWVEMPATLQSKTSISGLTPQTTVMFRYRAVIKTGEGDWSQPTSILVL